MKRPFRNPWVHDVHRLSDIFRWKLGFLETEHSELPVAPDQPAAWHAVSRQEIAEPPVTGWRVTWLGHASFLIQGGGVSLLIDPTFAAYCAPLPVPGLRRRVPPPCSIDDLPEIDLVLLTHSHYDHLDLPTLRSIGKSTPIMIAEGHASWLGRKGFTSVRELAWHGRVEVLPGIHVTSTPAQHFTARTPFDTNQGHWCGWLVEGAGCKLWHTGDSGYCPAFEEIGDRYGPIDFGMIPIGAYQPRRIMRAMHMNPDEAVRAFLDTRCRRAVAMHWGTFSLTDEPLGEPPILLERALRERSLAPGIFVAAGVGEHWEVVQD